MTDDDVKAWLRGRDSEELVALLAAQAKRDHSLDRELRLAAAKSRSKGIDLARYRAALRMATLTDGFIDFHNMADYAHGIEEAVSGIEDLLDEGYAAEVVDLTEDALQIVESAFESCDDSDGYLGGILENLQGLHLRACQRARPDPASFAERLFSIEIGSDFGVFHVAVATYAKVLGQKGLAAYRTLAEKRWAAILPLEPGARGEDKYGERSRITSIMETLAQQSGDVEALATIKKRDLSSPYNFLELAEVYEKAGKDDLAMGWAEKGMAAFPDHRDSRLVEFLAEQYHRRKRHDEAMTLVWREFVQAPRLDGYKFLERHARRIHSWPAWREKALATIRDATTRSDRQNARRWSLPGSDHSQLVEIFLWERNVNAAWAEAKNGGCRTDLWMELARRREKSHPEDALPIYRDQVEPTLRPTNDKAYRTAVALLQKIHRLMVQMGQEAEFSRYLEALRATHKAKRNLMKLLDRTSWA